MTEIVYAEPTNAAFVEGTRPRIKGASTAEKIAVVVCAILFISAIFMEVHDAVLLDNILSRGREASAQIFEHRTTGSGQAVRYYVSYRYRVDSVVYEREESVGSEEYLVLSIGRVTPARYLPGQPENARLMQLHRRDDLFVIVLEIVGGIVIVRALLLSERQRFRFSRSGTLIEGTLDGAFGTKLSYQGYLVTFVYRFVSPLGVELIGSTEASRKELRHAALPEAGNRVKVLYIDDKHHRML